MGHGVLRRTENQSFQIDNAKRRIEQLERRYRFPIGYYEIKCFADRNALDGNLDDSAILVSAGDGKFLFPIPPNLDESRLVLAEAGISVQAGGDIEVDISNCGADPESFPGTTMLTSNIVIPGGGWISWTYGAKDGTTPIDDTASQVQSGDWICVSVIDDGGGDGEGLVTILQFIF